MLEGLKQSVQRFIRVEVTSSVTPQDVEDTLTLLGYTDEKTKSDVLKGMENANPPIFQVHDLVIGKLRIPLKQSWKSWRIIAAAS